MTRARFGYGLWLSLGLVLILAAVAAWWFRSSSPEAPRWNVLLITLDTTRADRLGCYGAVHDTPTIDALSRQGVRFERCLSTAPITLPSHCSLMTGLVPLRHGVHDNGPDRLDSAADTMAEVLADQGYATAAVVGAVVLDKKFGLAQGFDHYDDEMPASGGQFRYAERRAENVTDAALRWLEQPRKRPFFLWVHYFDPHAPYGPPKYDPKFAARVPYDAEIRYVDQQLERLLDAVDAIPGETLVILTADHGEGLGQHGEDTHGLFAYNQTLRVPLVVRFPDGRNAGNAIRQTVGLVDVMPSVLAWLEIEPPGALDGVPLPAKDGLHASRAYYFENRFPTRIYGWSSQDGIVLDGYKLIRAPQPELFNLDQDPLERQDLFAAEPKTAQRMMAALADTVAHLEAQPTLRQQESPMTSADVARLQALGYAGAARGPEDEVPSAKSLPNPRDMLEVYTQLQLITNLLDAREVARGTELLIEVIESQDPHNKRAIRLLAAMSLDDSVLRQRSIACLQTAVNHSEQPSRDPFVLGKLGVALLEEDRAQEATEVFLRMVALDATSAVACGHLAEAYRRTGDSAQAGRWQQRALELADRSDELPSWASDQPVQSLSPSR